MKPPEFLEPEDVLRLHQLAIDATGGDPNVRDWGLLESAVAMPRQGFGGQYFHGSLASMAAAYFFHIVSNYAFVDGNKRTGTLAAYAFLKANGLRLDVDDRVVEDLAVEIASGTPHGKQKAIEFFEAHVKPAEAEE